MKPKKDYELISTMEIAVLIKAYRGKSYHYPYESLYTYLEVNAEFNRDTLKIEKWRDEEHWSYRLMCNETDTLANWQSRDRAINLVGIEAIEKAEIQVKARLREIKRTLNLARQNPVYLTMKVFADDYIEHYKADFEYHDCLRLYNENPEKFIWIVRKSGTWLLTNQNKWNAGLIESESKPMHENRQAFWYNNGKLQSIEITELNKYYEKLPKVKDNQ